MNRELLHANRKSRCAFCAHSFPEHALLGRTLRRKLNETKAGLGVRIRRSETIPSVQLEPVRLCLFCSQFFDSPTILDTDDIERSPVSGGERASFALPAGDTYNPGASGLLAQVREVEEAEEARRQSRRQGKALSNSPIKLSPHKRYHFVTKATEPSDMFKELELELELERLRCMRSEVTSLMAAEGLSPTDLKVKREQSREEALRRRNERLAEQYRSRTSIDRPWAAAGATRRSSSTVGSGDRGASPDAGDNGASAMREESESKVPPPDLHKEEGVPRSGGQAGGRAQRLRVKNPSAQADIRGGGGSSRALGVDAEQLSPVRRAGHQVVSSRGLGAT